MPVVTSSSNHARQSSLAISGYTCARKSHNRGTIGQPQYLWVRRATDADQARTEQLIEIQATIGKERAGRPDVSGSRSGPGIANGPRAARSRVRRAADGN